MKRNSTRSALRQVKTLYPWFVFILASSFVFYKYLLQVSPSVMAPELASSFRLSALSLGNMAAFYFYAYLIMQLPVGILLDHFSPKRLVAAAISVCAIGALLFGHASTPALANFGRLLIGLGGAFSAVGTMKLVTLWFPPNRFALVSGLMMSIGMLGAVAGEALLAVQVDRIGWRSTSIGCAIIGFALSVAVWCLIAERQSTLTPPTQQTRQLTQNIKRLVRSKQNWLISLYSGLAFAPISAFAGLWGIPFLTDATALPRHTIAEVVSLTFIGFAIGSPLSGWLSDRVKRRKPLMYIGTLVGAIILTMVITSPSRQIAILSIEMLCFGGFTSFFFISFATIREMNNSACSGTAIGFINMFNALFGALTEPLIGWLIDKRSDHLSHHLLLQHMHYQRPLMILPIGMIIALLLLTCVKETYATSQND